FIHYSPTQTYTLSLHDALPISYPVIIIAVIVIIYLLNSINILPEYERGVIFRLGRLLPEAKGPGVILVFAPVDRIVRISLRQEADRKSTRLNSSHVKISYAVFC